MMSSDCFSFCFKVRHYCTQANILLRISSATTGSVGWDRFLGNIILRASLNGREIYTCVSHERCLQLIIARSQIRKACRAAYSLMLVTCFFLSSLSITVVPALSAPLSNSTTPQLISCYSVIAITTNSQWRLYLIVLVRSNQAVPSAPSITMLRCCSRLIRRNFRKHQFGFQRKFLLMPTRISDSQFLFFMKEKIRFIVP